MKAYLWLQQTLYLAESLLVDRAILGQAMGLSEGKPAVLDAAIKPFPWPSVTLDLGAASAALAFNLLLVFAFFVPTRSMVTTIVREKELRLREGMRIFGLQVLLSFAVEQNFPPRRTKMA